MTKTAIQPDYDVRRSPRARRMRITVSSLGKVEVVVPKGVAARHIEPFVDQHQQWIAQAVARVASARSACGEMLSGIPEQIELRALNECWPIEQRDGERSSARELNGKLLLSGADEASCFAALQRWNSRKAQAHLLPWLAEVSREIDLPYSGVTIRGQKSRWGSCSSRGNISLNRKLLFLPAELVEYLFVHELCHTVHANHSRHFWALVEEKMPDYRNREGSLRGAMCYVPHWA
ncbi:M48 family metallopeptidase [Candidatus Reidiella endopervernicosa]|uniref:M48 family metallopeptidase n=1 Tax=Candidatus Reidiella endopervernicosa TaxID=2738883 RepID=A0A6N0HUX8_9GAMM|nr:SprT family zinc-dependent metalloprotease [Candidatus Reidiella endopervernicosa]QKQ26021.1 M48 family metallopeptidase [Candidatus Reidiella endopervernicosa]